MFLSILEKACYNNFIVEDDGKECMPEMKEAMISLIVYFVVCASTALVGHIFIKVPNEVFRKILHGILLGSLIVWTYKFPTWYSAAASAIAFAWIVYPILWIAEHIKGYSEFVTERKSGELKSSLLIVFFMYAVVVAICWGWLNDKTLALASIYAWGFGDAAAALVGKWFGKHKIGGKISHVARKSVEGTAAMFLLSFVCVCSVLISRGGLSAIGLIVTSLVVAAVSAFVELITPNGLDTITCPLAAMTVLLPMVYLFGGFKV